MGHFSPPDTHKLGELNEKQLEEGNNGAKVTSTQSPKEEAGNKENGGGKDEEGEATGTISIPVPDFGSFATSVWRAALRSSC